MCLTRGLANRRWYSTPPHIEAEPRRRDREKLEFVRVSRLGIFRNFGGMITVWRIRQEIFAMVGLCLLLVMCVGWLVVFWGIGMYAMARVWMQGNLERRHENYKMSRLSTPFNNTRISRGYDLIPICYSSRIGSVVYRPAVTCRYNTKEIHMKGQPRLLFFSFGKRGSLINGRNTKFRVR